MQEMADARCGALGTATLSEPLPQYPKRASNVPGFLRMLQTPQRIRRHGLWLHLSLH
jgi:hypothetical protein